jgi:glutaminyl-peptide cyclotransferase
MGCRRTQGVQSEGLAPAVIGVAGAARRALLVPTVAATLGVAWVAAGCGAQPVAGNPSVPDRVPAVRANGFDAQQAYLLTRQQVAVGPRPAGSPQLRALAVKLRGLLPGGRFESIPGWPRLRNIVATVPGTRGTIVVGAHYDTLVAPGFVGANNGAAGTAIVIELARALAHARRPPGAPTIRFVLYDGEEPPPGEHSGDFYSVGLRGSRADAAAHARDTRAMVLLDYVGNRNLSLPREGSSTPELWERIRAAAARVGAEQVFPGKVEAWINDDHTPYLRAGVPAVDMIDWSYPGHDPQVDTMAAISTNALAAVGETLLELVRSWRT